MKKSLSESQKERAYELIVQNNCAPTCHTADRRIIGPSFIDIANKYKSTSKIIDRLAANSVNGSIGVWGDIPMPPAINLSMVDSRLIITYILSLKTNNK
jgi:cytochrome c